MNALKRVLSSKLFLTLTCLLGLYTVAGFFLLPFLLRHYGPRLIHERTKKQAVIGQVRINPFLFTLEVQDFNVAEAEGQQLVAFTRFFCDFELKGIAKRAWTFRQITLLGPRINAVVAADGVMNLARLVPPSENPAPKTEDHAALPRLIVEEVGIDQARIDLVDRRQSQPASISYQLQLAINNFTTLPGQEGHLVLTAKGGEGEGLRVDGQLGLTPLRARGTAAVEGLHLSTPFQFVRDSFTLAPPQGTVALQAQYSLGAEADGVRATASALEIALDGLALKLQDAEAPFIELASLKLGGGIVDLSRQKIELKSVAASGVRARLAVDEKGLLNAGRMAKGSADTRPQAVAPARGGGTPWKVALGGVDLNDLSVEYRDQSRTPEVRAGIGKIKAGCTVEAEIVGGELRGAVRGIGVRASDVRTELANQQQPLIRIDTIGLDGGDFNLASKAFVAEKVAVRGGRIDAIRQADGMVNLAQLAPARQKAEGDAASTEKDAAPARFIIKTVALSGVDVAVSDLAQKTKSPTLTLRDIALSLSDVDGKSPMRFDLALKVKEGGQVKSAGTIDPAGPSVEAKVRVADLNLVPAQPYLSRMAAISLKSGTLSSTGSVRFGGKDSAAKKGNTYKGGFAVDRFRLTGVGDKETLVGWKSLRTEQLQLDLESSTLEIGDLKIQEPSSKIVVNKDHSLNLAKLIKKTAPTKKPATAKPGNADFRYRVRRVLVNGGKVDFADFSLITPFGTKIHEVNGAVTGISAQKGSRARLKLEGWVDNYGTANVKGELDTSDPKNFTDISLIFRNVEMARLTPYSGTFAGRQIKSGKLSVDLFYKINQGELAGDNKLKVERLTLGERVESPNAVNLPLDLAIALLEDSNGVIDLGLPVHGNLNAPEFSYGAIVGKALASVLIKIVTSPFRILGALLPGFGDNATLNAVAFEAGRTDIPPPEKEKLAKLAEVLQKRPQLKLTVTGAYSPVSDKAVLQARHVGRALAKILRQESEAGADPEAIDYGNSETEDGLISLFKETLGAEAYKAVKAENKAERKAEKEKAKTAAASGRARGDGAGEDPGSFAKLLFARLSQEEKIADGELAQLGNDRARAVINELAQVGKIPPERLKAMPAKGLDPKAPLAAELNLEAGP